MSNGNITFLMSALLITDININKCQIWIYLFATIQAKERPNVTEYRNPVKREICLRRGSNPGPLDLKSNALLNELKGYPDSRDSTSRYISTCDTNF